MPSYRPLTIRSYPKVNLALDIVRKHPSGYHEIRTVFHQLAAPYDEITLEMRDNGEIIVETDHPALPIDGTNTVLKAAQLLKKRASSKCGARVFIKKRIPLMSGLGGGSSNAVAALKGLAELWKIDCCRSHPEFISGSPEMLKQVQHDTNTCLLVRLALQIGMDCAFFFRGGTALGEHFGEKITPLPSLPSSLKFEVIDTGVEISSRWAYENIDIKKCGKNTEKTQNLIAAIRAGDAQRILENLHNDFEELVFACYPQLVQKKKARALRGLALLAGSGGALVLIHTSAFPSWLAQG